jgi:hypothetical protein
LITGSGRVLYLPGYLPGDPIDPFPIGNPCHLIDPRPIDCSLQLHRINPAIVSHLNVLSKPEQIVSHRVLLEKPIITAIVLLMYMVSLPS